MCGFFSRCCLHFVLETSSSLHPSTLFTSHQDGQVFGDLMVHSPVHSVAHAHVVNFFGYHVGLWYLLAFITLPISFLKQMVSVVQLVVACKNLGGLDAVARVRQKEAEMKESQLKEVQLREAQLTIS